MYPNDPPVTLALGLLNCCVFVKLNASARNTALNRSLIGNVRATLILGLVSPGPRSEWNPAVPKRQAATFDVEQLDPDWTFSATEGSAKFAGLKYGREALWPPRIIFVFESTSAKLLLVPAVLGPRELALPVTVKGVPLSRLSEPLKDQPPRMYPPGPFWRKAWPFPKGST